MPTSAAEVKVVVDEELIGTGAALRIREASVEHEHALTKVVDAKLAAADKAMAKAVDAAERTERRARRVASSLHWGGVGRLATALLPAAAIALSVALMTLPLVSAMRLDSLLGWSVRSMLDADGALATGVWAAIHLAAAAALVFGIHRAYTALAQKYRSWSAM
ncbi:hypothetical protein ABLE94_02615 [Gordonia sp. VNK1]|uniref:hypothetical protein n=1 Tax=Gordonia oleivorans TaxID=3156618 RepID=UPI0032B51BE9